MKNILLITTTLLFCGCSNMTPGQKALLNTAEQIGSAAVQAAATYYGGPAAGELASAGLSAVATVLQGYVGGPAPVPAIVVAAPGVKGVGAVAVDYLKEHNYITQATVDKIHVAATVAANATQ